jgi:hypothetical protein
MRLQTATFVSVTRCQFCYHRAGLRPGVREAFAALPDGIAISIYLFRHALPVVFREAEEAFPPRGVFDPVA